jgi:hypothetical protein
MAEEFEDRDLSGAVFKPMVFEAGLLHVVLQIGHNQGGARID